jgi:hypothetical protein
MESQHQNELTETQAAKPEPNYYWRVHPRKPQLVIDSEGVPIGCAVFMDAQLFVDAHARAIDALLAEKTKGKT